MQADRSADNPYARVVALAKRFARTGNIFDYVFGYFAFKGVNLRYVLSLIVGVYFNAVIAVLEQDGNVAVGVGLVLGFYRSAVGIVFKVVIYPNLAVGSVDVEAELCAGFAVFVSPVVVTSGVLVGGKVGKLLIQFFGCAFLGAVYMNNDFRGLAVHNARFIAHFYGEGGSTCLFRNEVI